MVAERDAATPTRAPGTKTGAMEAGSEASQVESAGGGVPTWTPPSSSKEENSNPLELNVNLQKSNISLNNQIQ